MFSPAPSIEQKFQSIVTDLGKALLHAAKLGNTDKVHELMSRGAPFTADWVSKASLKHCRHPVDLYSPFLQLGTTPLHLAARYNHIETSRVLLRAGISKDSKTKVDRTPLHLAVFHGNIEIVELLLSNKCEVDAKDMVRPESARSLEERSIYLLTPLIVVLLGISSTAQNDRLALGSRAEAHEDRRDAATVRCRSERGV